MRFLGTIVMLFLTLCSYAQEEFLNTEWVVKRVSHDTLLLSDKTFENNINTVQFYLQKPCEFQDTTYYWSFTKDSINITRTVRSCSKGWKEHAGQRTDNFKHVTNSLLVLKSDSINVDAEEIRLSLWAQVSARYELKNLSVLIVDAGELSGLYLIQILDSKRIRLILTRK